MELWKTLLKQAQGHARKAQEIAARNGGNLTTEDRIEYEQARDAAILAKERSDYAKENAHRTSRSKNAAADRNLLDYLSSSDDEAPDDDDDISLAKRHASTGNTGSSWAKTVIKQLTKAAGRPGRMEQRAGEPNLKAILAGSITVPPAVEIAPLPDKPVTLLDLIPRAEMTEATSSYLRQTVKTDNAAVVADGATKPTSIYTFTEIETKARVIAHLSEPFPERYLTDYDSLAQILDTQMVNGVLAKLEDRIVAGTGAGEDFRGILTTSGVTAVPYTSNAITTLRKARTALDVKGEKPNAWVLHPNDIEGIDLLREDGATGGFLMDTAAADVIFGPGSIRIPSLAVPEGTALFADWNQLRVLVRQGASTLASNQTGDLFDKNQVKLRSEGRFELEILRPQAIAVVDLTP